MIVLNLNRVTAKIRGKTGQKLVKNLSDIGCFFMTLYYLQLLHSMNYQLGQACFISTSALK